jgi:serine protease Do
MKLPLVMLLVLQGAVCAAAGPDRAALILLSASVLKVEATREQGGLSLGSGVVVAHDRVATNCHVLRNIRQAWVARGGVRWPADAMAPLPDLDICVLRVPGLQATPVNLGSVKQLRPGEHLTALGYTGGAELQFSEGELVALHPHADSGVIQSSNWFSSGASGGGLFDDQLALVGLLTFRLRGGQAHYFSAPADWLTPVLADGPRDTAVASLPLLPLPFWQESPSRLPAFLRLVPLEQGPALKAPGQTPLPVP